MNELQKKFEKWKVEREVDEYNESYQYREGYVKAMCDAINLVKNLDIPLVSQQRELLITAFTEADRTGYIELLTNAETIADKVISGNL